MDLLPPLPEDKTAANAEDALWYKDAVIYELHVKAFFDSNGDGIGDFRGLTQKLDYIQDLGVNTIWLLPFYPSPMRDDGYDVSDYSNIHPAYGTRQDFRNFVREAHRRGLRVITELIVNHTSDQHPWFQAARRAPPGSPKRGYYVWTDDPNRYAGTRIIFTDTESSNWSWDAVAQQHYWHRFFSHQPDLNFDNPNVLKAVLRVMNHWLDMGVDGFRLDAIPYLIEREGTNNENLTETHGIIKKIRAALDSKYSGKVLLAEANQWPEDVREYFGNDDECHMAYHFPLMPRLFMAIAMEDRYPVIEIMQQTPEIPANCQWAIFLRNHDELTLEMVTDRERDYMYQRFANDPQMRINVGIRRRLAPLMENSREQIELISFLLMTMPGSPILYYGDEIGMGDNIYLGDRNGVRTPMQWSPDRNAGFSRADPQRLYMPPIMDALYGYEAVNVEAQSRSPSSLLNWTKRMIAVRRSFKAFGRGNLTFLDLGNRKVLAYLREHDGESLLCVINLSRHAQAAELDLSRFAGRVPVEIFGKEAFPPVTKLPYVLTLPGHGYLAFRLAADVSPPVWHEKRVAASELPVLVMSESISTYFARDEAARGARQLIVNMTRERMRDEILLPYMSNRRWFAAKGKKILDMRFREATEWNTPEGSWLTGFLQVDIEGEEAHLYFLPLAIAWEGKGYDPLQTLGPWVMAKVRQKERIGVLYGAFGNPDFSRALAGAMARNEEIPFGSGKLRLSSTSVYPQLAGAIAQDVRIPPLEQSNTGVFLGNQLYLKGYRRMHFGVNPEVEIGRFLTDTSPYPNIAPMAGAVEYIDAQGKLRTLATLARFVENQGDVWTYTQEYLDRFLVTRSMPAESPGQVEEAEPHAFFKAQAEVLGRRIGELHWAFFRAGGDPAFEPEPTTAQDLAAWKDAILREAEQTMDELGQRLPQLSDAVRVQAEALLAARPRLRERISAFTVSTEGLMKTRYHGDLHFGQLLLAQNDFIVLDFEGEPTRPIEERRRKHSPLRDVAGMLRSASYAAYAALQRSIADHAERQESVREALREWEGMIVAAAMQGYRESVRGLPSVPADAAEMQALIDLLVIEKALYEMRYEMNNRPDWLPIPMAGLKGILER
ncbi:MAG TPA: maltose alpha-D-glucosyltransferase [Burkholderiales bacterium]|jgi:maltose alpha-D-glucosyltransferase/alpha-amylase|nr:maltose alpha-D-glucosyltransferase [Burkholderiales bacterium]